jgi:3-oxoacyl-[acyl-carrier-protein] synthase-3
MTVYINDISAFLPNAPVGNDQIEAVLGHVNNLPSRTKRIVLRNNRIEQRHYAIDLQTRQPTHTNAQLAAAAIRRLKPYDGFTLDNVGCLSCGTTCADVLFPGHALMVMGELKMPPCEVVTTHGICISGMTALKHAYLQVAASEVPQAIASASELASSFMRAEFFEAQASPEADLERRPIQAFDADFLRWMLSDGAGAMLLSDQPGGRDGRSLRIDWIDQIAYAGELETCMYAGGEKTSQGEIVGWRQLKTNGSSNENLLFSVRQDIKLLDKHIVPTMGRALKNVCQKRKLLPEKVDWFLPHYSSHYFRDKFYQAMKAIDLEIPYDRWFTNLQQKGNTGAAAIYIILEELFHSEQLKIGQRLLCFIPESGRFSHCFMHLTVV